ncbi:3-carboxy-cis,cis-muconate cycloisomerase [Telmatospirillum sp. J64-1]|uniref:3-carboxy-cis,cis-muconate cycloisomerase n=1 Tax=Telmatospirillum sp. J64-1 TaxID=2502183 RepID=UPI00115F1149|nr:3-carboxy-cis,cis-muconate cycloisomerase [Telmatospirillum sp. J64-1]
MSLNAFGPGMYGLLFSDPDVAPLLDEDAQIQAMLRVEAALARAEGLCGVIPAEAAEKIAAVAETLTLDPRDLAVGTARDGVPVPALVERLRQAVGGEAARYVHWGATSQDIVDTALVLNLRDSVAIIDGRLEDLAQRLAGLVAEHRATPLAARTRMQQATPTSFGLKLAGWLAPLLRHRDRLGELRGRVFTLSFGGASGNLAALGGDALAVEAALAEELGLATALLPWHVQRDGIMELAGWLALVTGSLGKIGTDMVLLSQSEVGEVRLAAAGGSSTMPNKTNPVGPEALIALARHNATQIGAIHQAALQEHERGGPGWQLEWMVLPSMAVAAAASLRHGQTLFEGLSVEAERMRANIAASQGLLLAEAASFALAQHMPRPEAQKLVKEACRKVVAGEGRLSEVLPRLTDAPVDWRKLDDPSLHLGASEPLIDRFLAALRPRLRPGST